MLADVDVFISNYTLVDPEIYQLWIEGFSSSEAVAYLKQKGFGPFQATLPELIASDVLSHYRTYSIMERLLHAPSKLFEQSCFQLQSHTRDFIIEKYYSIDDAVAREILGKKLSPRFRKDLDEVSEKTCAKLKSCRRQFDNVKRIYKAVEELPGNTIHNIKQLFFISEDLAKKYAAIVFLACLRFETSKKKLQYLTFADMLACSQAIMLYWTYTYQHSGPEFYDTEMDKEFLLDLRELRCLLEKEKEIKHLVCMRLKPVLLERFSHELDTNFRSYWRALITIACNLHRNRELRGIFVDLCEKLIDPWRQNGWNRDQVNKFISAITQSVLDLEISRDQETRCLWDSDDDANNNRKQNHSEIEKRRRDKMNTYIQELSSMIPMCYSIHRKLDKLTVLRMAVQHLRGLRGASVHSYCGSGNYKPTFLSDQELKMLILQAAEGFVFCVGCDRGRILYVSESVAQVLNCTPNDLLGQSWFDILHPKDVSKVKEQLSPLEPCPRRLIDAKTMLPVKTDIPQSLFRLCPGARRSFFCRMKLKANSNTNNNQIKEGSDTSSSSRSSNKRKSKLATTDYKYRVIQCTGILKSWTPIKEEEQDNDDQMSNLTCLVAIGRLPPNVLQSNVPTSLDLNPNIRNVLFVSRHSVDGKFLFIDQRATLVIGFLPQEILGTSFYEYFHQEDIPTLAESHKMVLQIPERVTTQVYRFRCKDNNFIQLQSEWRAFKNPWTTDIEYIIAKNSVFL